MSESELEDHHAVRVPKIDIEVNGTPWDFQEFCTHVSRCMEFLGTTSRYKFIRFPIMEGMEEIWELFDSKTKTKIAPTLTFSFIRNGWVGCDHHGEFVLAYTHIGDDPMAQKSPKPKLTLHQ